MPWITWKSVKIKANVITNHVSGLNIGMIAKAGSASYAKWRNKSVGNVSLLPVSRLPVHTPPLPRSSSNQIPINENISFCLPFTQQAFSKAVENNIPLEVRFKLSRRLLHLLLSFTCVYWPKRISCIYVNILCRFDLSFQINAKDCPYFVYGENDENAIIVY